MSDKNTFANTEEKGIIGIVKTLLTYPLKVSKALFVILTTLIAFGLILIFLLNGLHYYGVTIPFINLDPIYSNTSSSKGISYFSEEKIPYKIKDISVTKINVIALDNLSYSEDEIEQLKALSQNSKEDGSEFERKLNFNTLRICENMRYPIQDPSFKRLEKILRDPTLDAYYSTEERKEAFLSEEYWKLKECTPKVLLFPKKPQISIAVLTITGVYNEGGLEIRGRAGLIDEAIVRATDGETLKIPYNSDKNSIKVLMFEGETIVFESSSFRWRIKLTNLSNPGSWREEFDLTTVEWSAKRI